MIPLHPRFTSPMYESSFLKNIPIQHLDEVRSQLKSAGLRIHIRFRGPRTHAQDTRCRSRRMQDAVKRYATRFSVYLR
jgi:hypothetical protein